MSFLETAPGPGPGLLLPLGEVLSAQGPRGDVGQERLHARLAGQAGALHRLQGRLVTVLQKLLEMGRKAGASGGGPGGREGKSLRVRKAFTCGSLGNKIWKKAGKRAI